MRDNTKVHTKSLKSLRWKFSDVITVIHSLVREGFKKKKIVEFSTKRGGGGVRFGGFSTKKNIVSKCILGHFQCF